MNIENEDKSNSNIIFIEVQNYLLKLNCIYSIERINTKMEYNKSYNLVINKSENKQMMYANTIIRFKTKIQRNKAYLRIKELLQNNNIIIEKI